MFDFKGAWERDLKMSGTVGYLKNKISRQYQQDIQGTKHKEPMFSPFPLCPYIPFSNPLPQPSSSTVCPLRPSDTQPWAATSDPVNEKEATKERPLSLELLTSVK